MKTDLFGIDPQERIAELERRNKELQAALKQAVIALRGLRPALAVMHEAMDAVGQSFYDSAPLLGQEKELNHESH